MLDRLTASRLNYGLDRLYGFFFVVRHFQVNHRAHLECVHQTGQVLDDTSRRCSITRFSGSTAYLVGDFTIPCCNFAIVADDGFCIEPFEALRELTL